MENFQVDADFFLDTAIHLEELVQYLTVRYQQSSAIEEQSFVFRMNADDSIDIRFIVKSDSYEAAATLARGLLGGIAQSVEKWLRVTSPHSFIEDESLLLMPA